MVRRVGLKGLSRLQPTPTSVCRFLSGGFRWGLLLSASWAGLLLGTGSAREPSQGAASETHPLDTPAGQMIDAREIACRAAQQWLPAEILRARARTLIQLYSDQPDNARLAANTLASFLQHQAAHQEDTAAASAMRAYYTRIALAEQLSILAQSFELIEEEAAKQQSLLAGGLAAGTDLSAFERRRIELSDQQLQLESQDRELRSLLCQLTKLDYGLDDIHQEQLEIHSAQLDCPHLKELALAQRCDLRSWKLLASKVNSSTAPEFAKMLPTLVGGWSLPLPLPTGIRLKQLLCPTDYSDLAANMKRELALMIAAQADAICQVIDEKCHKLQLAYQRIDLAQQMIDSWRERIAQLEQLEGQGEGKAEQKTLARVELLKVRGEEVSRRLEARLAEIDLAEATGCLAARCCSGQAWLRTGVQ